MWYQISMAEIPGHPRISMTPGVKSGRPVITGTRIPVELLLKLLGKGWTVETLLEQYPGLEHADVLAAQAFAAELLPRGLLTAAE
jgi:uncharacterized protein (DUF433 family)